MFGVVEHNRSPISFRDNQLAFAGVMSCAGPSGPREVTRRDMNAGDVHQVALVGALSIRLSKIHGRRSGGSAFWGKVHLIVTQKPTGLGSRFIARLIGSRSASDDIIVCQPLDPEARKATGVLDVADDDLIPVSSAIRSPAKHETQLPVRCRALRKTLGGSGASVRRTPPGTDPDIIRAAFLPRK
jgi:hypothetical protein